MLISQVSALVVTTALSVLVARELGPSSFGVLAALQGLAQLLTIFVDAGISTYVLRELSAIWAANDDRDGAGRAGALVSGALTATAAAVTVLLVASSIVGALTVEKAEHLAALVGLVGYTSLLACADTLETVYRARRRLRLLACAIALEKTTLVALVATAVLTNGGLPAIAAGYLAAGVVRLVFDVTAVRRLGVLHWQRPTRGELGSTLRASLPFGLSSTVPTAIVRFDASVIGLFSTTAAGLYAVGDKVLTALLVVSSTAAATLYPLLARERNTISAAWRAAAGMLAGGLVIAAIGIALAPELVPAVFGHRFDGAVAPVQLMLLAVPLIYGSSMLMVGLFSLGRETTVLRVSLPCVVAGTAFVVAGQAIFGVKGAAAGYALRYVAFSSAMALATARVARARTRQDAPIDLEVPAES